MKLDQDVLDEIIRRVVETARPERIILFGSVNLYEMLSGIINHKL
jgi:hypothetical protein